MFKNCVKYTFAQFFLFLCNFFCTFAAKLEWNALLIEKSLNSKLSNSK